MNEGKLPVSVIVPVYNAELTLEKCIKSINTGLLPQEIIVVDDASVDGSVQLVKRLANVYGNIRLISRPTNGGAAEARRDGLFAAECKYYAFVDADDYLEAGALEEAYAALIDTGSDMCIWQLWRSNADRVYEHIDLSRLMFPITGLEAAALTLGAWAIHPLGVASRDIYLRAYASFSSTSMNSDELITRLAFVNARKVVACSKRYFYTVNMQSTTNSDHPGRLTVLDSDIWLLKFCETYSFNKSKGVLKSSMDDLWMLFRLRQRIGIRETKAKFRLFTHDVCFVKGFFPGILRCGKGLVKFLLVSLYCRIPTFREM
jgi:glycosyltransferase involved in cell wall biosynthesis